MKNSLKKLFQNNFYYEASKFMKKMKVFLLVQMNMKVEMKKYCQAGCSEAFGLVVQIPMTTWPRYRRCNERSTSTGGNLTIQGYKITSYTKMMTTTTKRHDKCAAGHPIGISSCMNGPMLFRDLLILPRLAFYSLLRLSLFLFYSLFLSVSILPSRSLCSRKTGFSLFAFRFD